MESKGIKAARTQYLQSNKTWKQTVLSNISTTSLQLLQIKFNKENQKEKFFFFSPISLKGWVPIQSWELSKEYEEYFTKVKLHIVIVCLASQQRASSTHEKFSS